MFGTKGIRRFMARLEDGREVIFFLNRKTGLIVVDVLELDDEHGTEVCRTIAPKPWIRESEHVQ